MQLRTRVKFCGITRLEDAQHAAALGVDALGFVFYNESPRYIDPRQAARIVRAVAPFVTTVGLFVDADPSYLEQVLDTVPIDILQFHGSESAEACARTGRRYIKAIPMSEEVNLEEEAARYKEALALLVDTYDPALHGGTGTSFGWERLPKKLDKPIILAGGLRPSNVAKAIATVAPYAVDVSSGIEREKGIKDSEKMTKFINEVI